MGNCEYCSTSVSFDLCFFHMFVFVCCLIMLDWYLSITLHIIALHHLQHFVIFATRPSLHRSKFSNHMHHTPCTLNRPNLAVFWIGLVCMCAGARLHNKAPVHICVYMLIYAASCSYMFVRVCASIHVCVLQCCALFCKVFNACNLY